MRVTHIILLSAVLLGVQTPAMAFDLDSISNSAADAMSDSVVLTGDAKNLVDSISSQLGVTDKQAAGGTAALLSMAKSQLSSDQFQAISDKMPSVTELLGGEGSGFSSSVLSKLTNMDGVANAFTALGLSPEHISQFTPMILKFLGDQDVTSGVLNSLKGLWGAAG